MLYKMVACAKSETIVQKQTSRLTFRFRATVVGKGKFASSARVMPGCGVAGCGTSVTGAAGTETEVRAGAATEDIAGTETMMDAIEGATGAVAAGIAGTATVTEVADIRKLANSLNVLDVT